MKSQDSQLLLTRSAQTRLIEEGGVFALQWCMKEPSAKRQRTLALHERALRFSCNVNRCCPERFSGLPSSRVWDQLIRAADSTSNNLVEADGASSDADFLSKMGIALREAKESSAALMKVRVCGLDNAHKAADLNLESGPVSLRRSSPRSS